MIKFKAVEQDSSKDNKDNSSKDKEKWFLSINNCINTFVCHNKINNSF